jgi:hypothetical protein
LKQTARIRRTCHLILDPYSYHLVGRRREGLRLGEPVRVHVLQPHYVGSDDVDICATYPLLHDSVKKAVTTGGAFDSPDIERLHRAKVQSRVEGGGTHTGIVERSSPVSRPSTVDPRGVRRRAVNSIHQIAQAGRSAVITAVADRAGCGPYQPWTSSDEAKIRVPQPIKCDSQHGGSMQKQEEY